MSMLSRKVLATEPRLDVDPATLPDGDYRAIWGGYVVQFWIEEKCYEAKTDIGIRTMGMACRVKISNGEIEVIG